ncbi:MAG: methyltransferase regulatory domain-containing protein [Pseudomonadota bacterium]
MSDWNEGYVTDIGYTYGYYTELNPLRTRLALLNAGWVAPAMLTDGPACELGMGQGVSVNVHAAASGNTWYGTDFNPSQAAFAQELAGASGVDAQGTRLFDEAFADFCQRPDLPDFSYIGVHGIWSWISDANRAVIVDFVRRKLKVGGVLYISYNTQPGWAAMVPMRDLLTEHVQVMGAPGNGIASRIDASLAFAERLMDSNCHYAQANPQVGVRLKRMQGVSRNYLAHEYFNRDWQPMSFSSMARWLEPAKLGYGCSAHYMDHLPALNFTPAQHALLLEQPDAMFRETVRDFLVNQQFRRDYWIKGGRRLVPADQALALRQQRVILATPAADVVMKVKAPVGEASLTPAIYAPVVAALADHQVHSIGDLWQQLQAGATKPPISFAQLVEAMVLLVGKGDVVPVQDEAAVEKARPQTEKLNRHLLGMARNHADISCVASPVSAAGVTLSRFQQLFLLAMLEAKRPVVDTPDPAVLAAFAWAALQALGQRLLKDGKPMEAAQDNINELTVQATEFINKRLPTLRRLGIVE